MGIRHPAFAHINNKQSNKNESSSKIKKEENSVGYNIDIDENSEAQRLNKTNEIFSQRKQIYNSFQFEVAVLISDILKNALAEKGEIPTKIDTSKPSSVKLANFILGGLETNREGSIKRVVQDLHIISDSNKCQIGIDLSKRINKDIQNFKTKNQKN